MRGKQPDFRGHFEPNSNGRKQSEAWKRGRMDDLKSYEQRVRNYLKNGFVRSISHHISASLFPLAPA